MDEFAGIAETYDWTEQATDDISFFVDLARQAHGSILEIGAGTGRITIPVATQGKPVTALDISASMLYRAQVKSNSNNIFFVLGDFRSLSLDRSFELILAPGRVFEHALTEEERHAAFAGCATHLQQTGTLALYVWGQPADSEPVPTEKTRMIDPTDEHGHLRFSWREERDFKKQLRRHYFKIEEIDGQERTWKHDPIEVRWYTPEALDRFAQTVGLTVQGRFRDFNRNSYESGSLHMIWVYKKE